MKTFNDLKEGDKVYYINYKHILEGNLYIYYKKVEKVKRGIFYKTLKLDGEIFCIKLNRDEANETMYSYFVKNANVAFFSDKEDLMKKLNAIKSELDSSIEAIEDAKEKF